MIKNIVFDISNVLAPFRFKEYLAEKGFDAAMITFAARKNSDSRGSYLRDMRTPPEGWPVWKGELCK